MKPANAETVFRDYLNSLGLRQTRPRDQIVRAFLAAETHVTVEDIYRTVHGRDRSVGLATVYRTMKLLCGSGLCRELRFEDGTSRYEHLYGHQHHDHLICTACGKYIEVVDPDIERLQDKLCKRHGFYPQRHRMEMYGRCRECGPA